MEPRSPSSASTSSPHHGPHRPPSMGGAGTVTSSMATMCSFLMNQGYSGTYALLFTLSLGIGGALIAHTIGRHPNDSGSGGTNTPRWA